MIDFIRLSVILIFQGRMRSTRRFLRYFLSSTLPSQSVALQQNLPTPRFYLPLITGAGVAAYMTVSNCSNLASCKSEDTPDNKRTEQEDTVYQFDNEDNVKYKMSKMQESFNAKASLEYNGEYLMTGRDFLEAWITEEFYEKPKLKLYDSEYETLIQSIRIAREQKFDAIFSATALISYPDYVFLRSILFRPDDLSVQSFRMLDLDKNGYVSVDEFETLYQMFMKTKQKIEAVLKPQQKTTLRVLLFGHNDSEKVTLNKFQQLLKDVQHHCLKAEFEKFRYQKNIPGYISVPGFMRAVLRRTKISDIQRARFIDKAEVYRNIDAINFTQFTSMINLLNNFSDFEVAVRMHQIAKKPVSKNVFKRAVFICCGEKMDDELIDILFYIFDEAGDGHLSHSEFVNVMKERQTNVLSKKQNGPVSIGNYFNKCIRTQMWRSYA